MDASYHLTTCLTPGPFKAALSKNGRRPYSLREQRDISGHPTRKSHDCQSVGYPFGNRLTARSSIHHNTPMRVIAGEAKGRRLRGPRGVQTRATADKVKGALFNILADRIIGLRMLDLFAGTGAVGIEALSRGAAHVDFVESDEESVELLEDNLTACGFMDRASIHRSDAFRFIKKEADAPYALVFADPPYYAWQIKKLLPVLGRGDILSPGGLAVVEHFRKTDVPEAIGRLRRLRTYEYGGTVLTFYERLETE